MVASRVRQVMEAETRPVALFPPVNQSGPPMSAPITRPIPAAVKNPAIMVAREAGINSVDRERHVTIANSKKRKTKNRPVNANVRDCPNIGSRI